MCAYVCVDKAGRKQQVIKCEKCYCLQKFQEYLSHLVIITDKVYSQYLTIGRTNGRKI